MASFAPPFLSKQLKKHLTPALLVYSKKEAQEKITFIKEYFPESHLHIDVMDKKFVPAGCWCSPRDIGRLALTNSFEAHLMTYHPERRIAAWKRAGATRIVFHYEDTPHPEAVIRAVRAAHLEVCIAINPDTPVSALRLLGREADAILIMGVHPGYAGQKFIKKTLKKIESAKEFFGTRRLIIVDGGVTKENAPLLIQAGARQLISTSAVFQRSSV